MAALTFKGGIIRTQVMNFKENTGRAALVALALVTAVRVGSGQVPPAETLADLQARLSEQVTAHRFDAAMWGVKVVSLDNGKTLFEHNQEKLFSPASNSKLYTVALALDRLGADFRVRTSLYAQNRPAKSGVLKGDLIVFGRGDPCINARLNEGEIFHALAPLVFALTNAGVKRIAGDLVGDGSYFHGPPFGSGWDWQDMEYAYGAEISALTINDNTIQVTAKPAEREGLSCKLALDPASGYLTFSNRTQTVKKGEKRTIRFHRALNENVVYVSGQIPLDDEGYKDELTVHNPAGLFIALFKEALARSGIKVSGKLRTKSWTEQQLEPIDFNKLVELGHVESLPMSALAAEVMKPSQNLYADLLLAQVGERARKAESPPDMTSERLGLSELTAFLAEDGIRKGDVQFEEGSGLSRNNLTTPVATVELLKFMSHHKTAQAFLDALPIAGVDGTLRNRMKGTPAERNLRAKTGTLRWANSLSGYVTSAAGEHLVFSIMLNRFQPEPGSKQSARAELDSIGALLAGLKERTDKGDAVSR